jgi:alpha-L-fucosidase
MRYVVATAKHHEGFCLWDSQLTDYTAARSPARRDLLRPMLQAFRDRQMHTGLYYSLIDWHHPHFVADPHIGPYRKPAQRAKVNKAREQAKYARYINGQVHELLTGYGTIDLLWFDFSYPREDGSGKGRDDWQSRELVAMARQLQPKVLINDRLDLLDEPGGWDFRTVEQAQPTGPLIVGGQPIVWESCHTFSGAWGYHRDESTWKSAEQVVTLLIDAVSKGGNFLLNVGPTGRGELDERAMSRLATIGEWMRRHGRSIYECGVAPGAILCPQDCRLTYHAGRRRLYVHVLNWPATGELLIDTLPWADVGYAQLLNDASEIPVSERRNAGGLGILLKLPVQRPAVIVPVVEVFLQ